MTNPISKYAPNNDDGNRQPFTDKKDLENVPLVITTARTAKSDAGRFWIVEAVRQDTNEAVVFTGSTAIDRAMAAVKDDDGFPVAAMVVKVKGDNPQGWYWNLVDPPGAPASDGETDRVAEVQGLIQKWGLFIDDVTAAIKEVVGEEKKVRELDDDQYAAVLELLESRAIPSEPPF